MKSRIFVTVAAVASALALGSSLAVWEQNNPPPAPAVQPQSEVAVESDAVANSVPAESTSEPQTDEGYWMRGWQGRLGVFVGTAEEPEMVFDVYVKNLPEADQELLDQGLYVAEYADLVSRIEDYIS